MTLFGDPSPPELKLSADRRFTLKVKKIIERGIHPLTGLALANNGETCGSCVHRVLVRYHNRTYPKCDLTTWTHGRGSDCRRWWPACTRWEQA